MPVSFIAPSAQWFAAAEKTVEATPKAGSIVFDGHNGSNSFTIMGSNLVTPVGHGFYAAGRIYTHFGFAETPDAGEWLFYRADLGKNHITLHSPILESDTIVLPVSGTCAEKTFGNVRLTANEDGSFTFHYTKPDNGEIPVYTISPKDWLSEHLAPVLVNVTPRGNFLLITFSPRDEGDVFPMEDFLYTIVLNRSSGKFLGYGLRRNYYAMSSRFDSYIELGYAYGPVGEHDWWPVFYTDIWTMALKNMQQPLWTFEDSDIRVTYRTGHAAQNFSLS